MKRCHQCNRVETDDTLVFCRADGTPLISDSGPVSEIETSVLPHTSTTPEINRAIGPTMALAATQIQGTTQELRKPKRLRVANFQSILYSMICATTSVLLI